MAKNFVVIGCGRFGRAIATTLYKLGHDVLAIDSNEEIIQNIAGDVTKAVTSQIDEQVLREIGVPNCDVAIVSMGSDIESSVITTLLLKEMKIPYIVCKASTEIHEKILYKIGADRVVSPERDSGIKIAKNLVSDNVLDKIDLDPDYAIFELIIPKSWIGKSLIELNVRKEYNLNVVAIKKDDDLVITPNPEEPLKENDIILLLGDKKNLKYFEQKIDIKTI